MLLEFGSCRVLYGCVGMTATEVYSTISRMKNLTALVLEGSTSVNDCDIAVVDTVATLMVCRPFIHSNMVVIVCDSPVNIASLSDITPYDYTGDIFGNFELRQPAKISSPKSSAIKIQKRKNDLVLEAVQSIVVIGFLTEYNSIMAKLNGVARKGLRAKIISLMRGASTVEQMEDYLASMSVDSTNFIAKLRTPYFKSLSKAVIYRVQGHSLAYVKKHYRIEDEYEISYFAKMMNEMKS